MPPKEGSSSPPKPPPVSPWPSCKTPTRRLLLLATVVYACVGLFWSARSIGAFTSRLDDSVLNKSSGRLQQPAPNLVLGFETTQNLSHGIRDFPAGDTGKRSLKCVAWRTTRECSPEGPRDPEQDQNCSQIVSKGESGFCEVEDVDTGERFQVMRRHCNSIRQGVPFRCQEAQDFVDFRLKAFNTLRAAMHSSFKLPNVAGLEEAGRNGIVMVVYPKLLASAYATIRVLRDVLHCQLPIEIWFRPDEMKPNARILEPFRRLAAAGAKISFLEIQDPRAKRFVAKVHAIYNSRFDRVLFLDADNVPVRDPTVLFESPEFEKTGAVFWPDFWHPDSTIFGLHENSLLWELLDMPFVDMFEQESGQLLVDRRRHAAPLELVRFYALHRPDFFSSLKLVWGDKDLFRLAWLKLEIPFHMIQTPPGMAGTLVDTLLRSDFCGMTIVQHDAEGEVLFMHRNQHKLTGKYADQPDDASLHEKAVDAVPRGSATTYADPAIWTHLMRFHKGSSRRDYAIQTFRASLDFEENQKCFGRRDVYRNPHFYIQEIAASNFSTLETQLRYYALESTQLSPDT